MKHLYFPLNNRAFWPVMRPVMGVFLSLAVALTVFGLPASSLAQTSSSTSTSSTSAAPNYTCIPAIKIVADLGYCFGFSLSYFDATDNVTILNAIEEQDIAANIAAAHKQCYATNFTSQQKLGELAFSSYINLEDDALLTRTAADCRILLDYYAKQRASE